MSEDIEHCERCNKPFDDDLIDFYEDEEGGGIWCCEGCTDGLIEKERAEIKRKREDTPMGRIMGSWPGDETDADIEKGLASLRSRRKTMQKPIDVTVISGSSHCSTAVDVVHAWMRGETEYPGDSYIAAAMNAYIQEHIQQRHYGMSVLASSELDNAQRLIFELRKYFSL